jgi:hypothetical protein
VCVDGAGAVAGEEEDHHATADVQGAGLAAAAAVASVNVMDGFGGKDPSILTATTDAAAPDHFTEDPNETRRRIVQTTARAAEAVVRQPANQRLLDTLDALEACTPAPSSPVAANHPALVGSNSSARVSRTRTPSSLLLLSGFADLTNEIRETRQISARRSDTPALRQSLPLCWFGPWQLPLSITSEMFL